MRILVSACLLGENCKYSGGNNKNDKVLSFIEGHEVIPVCPEVLGGLTTPRTPCEIHNGIVVDADGVSRDREFRLGAQKALEIGLENKVDLAILQSRSPSCGVKQVYSGTFDGTLVPGSGVFASLLKSSGIDVLDAEDV